MSYLSLLGIFFTLKERAVRSSHRFNTVQYVLKLLFIDNTPAARGRFAVRCTGLCNAAAIASFEISFAFLGRPDAGFIDYHWFMVGIGCEFGVTELCQRSTAPTRSEMIILRVTRRRDLHGSKLQLVTWPVMPRLGTVDFTRSLS